MLRRDLFHNIHGTVIYSTFYEYLHCLKMAFSRNIFNFPVAVDNSIKVGPLVFLLYMFVITENIMKRPVLRSSVRYNFKADILTASISVFSDTESFQFQSILKGTTCTRHSHEHRMAVTRGCIDTICLS